MKLRAVQYFSTTQLQWDNAGHSSMCAAVISCPVEHRLHTGELTILKRKRWARRQSCPVKSLNMAVAAAQGASGTQWEPVPRILQGLAREEWAAAVRKECLKTLFISSFEEWNGKFLLNFWIILHPLFAKKSAFSFPSTPQWQDAHWKDTLWRNLSRRDLHCWTRGLFLSWLD